jgi:hypothetical protein
MGPSKELDLTRNQDCIFFWDLLGEYGGTYGMKNLWFSTNIEKE